MSSLSLHGKTSPWKTLITTARAASTESERVEAFSAINSHCKYMKRPERHEHVILSNQNVELIIKNKFFNVLKVSEIKAEQISTELLACCIKCIESGDLDSFSCFKQVIQTTPLKDQIIQAAKEKAVKGQPQFLLSIVKFMPKLESQTVSDYCKSAINQESSINTVISILSSLEHSLDFGLDVYVVCKLAKSKTAALGAIHGKTSSNPKTLSLLLELLRKETVESNGELLASISGRLLAENEEFQKFLLESVKSARPKAFTIKAIYYANLSQKYNAELKQLMSKESKTPTSNDIYMTLVALLNDSSSATIAQRAGYFLNDGFVVDAEGMCVQSVVNQDILLSALLVVCNSKGDLVGKAVDRLVELIIYGDSSIVSKAVYSLAGLQEQVKRLVLDRACKPALYNTHSETRIRRILIALIKDESLQKTIFYSLLDHTHLRCNRELIEAVKEIINYEDALEFGDDAFFAALPFIDAQSVESHFFPWLCQLPSVIDEDHIKVWSGVESDTPILSVATNNTAVSNSKQPVKNITSVPSVKKPATNKPDPAVEKQLERERQMRLTVQTTIKKLEKSVLMLQYMVSRRSLVVKGIEDHFETILKIISIPKLQPVIGQSLIVLFRLIGGGRLLVSEGVRFADWVLTIMDLPIMVNDLYLTKKQLPCLSPSLAAHPGPAVFTLEKIVETDDSIESYRGVLLFVERHARELASGHCGRLMRIICEITDRCETLIDESKSAVHALGSACVGSPSADHEIVHSLLVSEIESTLKLTVQFCRLSITDQVPPSLRTILSVHNVIDGSVPVEQLLDYLCKYKHLNTLISAKICENLDIVGLKTIIDRYNKLLSTRMPEGPKERVALLDLTLEERALVGAILSHSKSLSLECYTVWFQFAVETGLCDPSPVSGEAASAVFESCRHIIIDQSDAALMESLIPIIEVRVKSASVNHLTMERQDMYKTWLIVIMAILSRSLSVSDPRRLKIMTVLLDSLETPSETVQMAVADGMAPLVGEGFDPNALIYNRLVTQLSTGKTMAARRGAAFGLGALWRTNGLGLLFERQFLDTVVMPNLTSSDGNCRQGALFAVEMMARYLPAGLFDPILPLVLPTILSCFAEGGGKPEVREAAMDATQAILATSLSMHTVKMILPILFAPLDTSSSQWRSRVAALEWLGQMASTKGRRALAQYLPQIIPRLTEGLSDAHAQVQRAARESLLQYGRVLRNPEIQRLFPLLLQALADPPNCTARCLDKIVETSFTHVVDGPSLALLEPMLVRALTERMSAATTTSSSSAGSSTASVQVKKRAAQIIGNLGSIIDPIELIPCLPGLTRALMTALGDPVPEVRSVSARVLGVLSKVVDKRKSRVMIDIEEACIKAVVNPDRDTIQGRIDRAGQAQAAAEIFAHSHGPTITATMLDGPLRPTDERDFVAMEGFIRLVGYLPAAFAARNQAEQLFEEAGLATLFHDILLRWYPTDPEPASLVDSWREASERTLRLLISRYSLHDPVNLFLAITESISDLSPGITASRGRQLAWKLLFEEYLGRVFPPADRPLNPDDDVPGSASVMAAECPTGQDMMTLLPSEAVKRLQAAAFLSRYDLNSNVRTIASGAWKALSEHPVRVILDTLPYIVDILCDCLDTTADDGEDDNQQEQKSEHYLKAIEELLERMGDRVFLPLLNSVKEKLLVQSPSIGPIILTATCLQCISSSLLTRLQQEAAVKIAISIADFSLSESTSTRRQQVECGKRVFPLLVDLQGAHQVIAQLTTGLHGVVRVRADLVLPVLLPTLDTHSLDTVEQLLAGGADESLAPWAIDLLRILLNITNVDEEKRYRLLERIIVNCLPDQESVMQFADLANQIEDNRVKARLVTIYLQSHKERLFDYLLYELLTEPSHYDLAMSRVMSPADLLHHINSLQGCDHNLYVMQLLLPILTNPDILVNEKQSAVGKLIDTSKLGPSTCTALIGALIRLLVRRTADSEDTAVYLQAIHLLLNGAHSSVTLKPFHPQLIKVLVATMPASRDCLMVLKPQLGRPQLLETELEQVVGGKEETTVRRECARSLLQ